MSLCKDIAILDKVKKDKKKKPEAAGCAANAALLKACGKESVRIRETSAIGIGMVDQTPKVRDPLEGPIIKVVLLTEGLGNRHDMNYYGPEAVQSMPQAFEGAPMFFDHPSVSEEKDIPERRVRSKVGYFKNLRVETIEGKLGCVGEVHFDLSEDGSNAYKKAMTAIHYRNYPGRNREYVGLSVNASTGSVERRAMKIEGKTESVKYVLKFSSPADSCDMVTIPARGGAFLALMESVRYHKEETSMETLKRLEAAQAALKEAEGEKDADARQKKVIEARQVVDSLLEDIREAKKQADMKKQDEDEDEDEAKKKKQAESEDESEAEKKKQAEKKQSEKKDKESDRELKELAAKALIKESGIAEKYFNLDRMVKMDIAGMKEYVGDKKQMHEAAVEDIQKVLAAHPARESGLPAVDGKANINDSFAVPKA